MATCCVIIKGINPNKGHKMGPQFVLQTLMGEHPTIHHTGCPFVKRSAKSHEMSEPDELALIEILARERFGDDWIYCQCMELYGRKNDLMF